MSLGDEDSDWVVWTVWTIIKWSAIAMMVLMAILAGWLVVLVALPAHASDGESATIRTFNAPSLMAPYLI